MRQSARMAALQLIGYWRSDLHPEYPDPHSWVDEELDEDERHQTWFYFASGTMLRTFMGQSPCRICGVNNGAVEYTDGFYVWPEGLAHYIYDHAVRLPQQLVDHAATRLDASESQEISTSWWLSAR